MEIVKYTYVFDLRVGFGLDGFLGLGRFHVDLNYALLQEKTSKKHQKYMKIQKKFILNKKCQVMAQKLDDFAYLDASRGRLGGIGDLLITVLAGFGLAGVIFRRRHLLPSSRNQIFTQVLKPKKLWLGITALPV